MKVSLSIDNGPAPEVTESVLEVLAHYQVHATFFVIGEKLARRELRRLAERAHAEGHWIGNHSLSHTIPLGERPGTAAAHDEIGRAQELIGDLSHPNRLFRPFGGGGVLGRHLLSLEAYDYLCRGGYTCVLWNCVPHDWDDPEGWVDRALAQCAAQPWTLLVVHDLPTGAMRHLDRFINEVRQRGGDFVQDFPSECVPILRGAQVGPVDSLITRP